MEVLQLLLEFGNYHAFASAPIRGTSPPPPVRLMQCPVVRNARLTSIAHTHLYLWYRSVSLPALPCTYDRTYISYESPSSSPQSFAVANHWELHSRFPTVINDSRSVLPLCHFQRWCMGRDLTWAQEKGHPLLTKLAVLWPELSGRKIIAIKRMYRF